MLGEPRTIRHYEGAAALDSDDFLAEEKLSTLKAHRIWAINNVRDADGWKASAVAVPEHWKEVSRHTYREAYSVQGSVVLVEYIERHGTERSVAKARRARE